MLRRVGACSPLPIRHFSGPPLKRYSGLRNWPQLVWQIRVPALAKLFGGILGVALSLTHIHPNTLVTVAPPLAVGAFFANKRLNHMRYMHALGLVRPTNSAEWDEQGRIFRIWNYDERSVANVARGLNSQYEHFQAQILELLERKLVDYAIEQDENRALKLVKLFLDENGQLVVHLGERFETFVSSQAEVIGPDGTERFSEFRALSVAIYSSKSVQKRKRLGVAEVTLLSVPETELESVGYTDFRVSIKIVPYELWGKPEVVETGTEIISAESFKNETN